MRYVIEDKPAYSTLRVFLEPGEEIYAEPGAMVAIYGEVEVESKAYGGLIKALARLLGGESLFLNRFRALSSAEIWLAPPVPGDIEAVKVDEEGWIVQDMSYLAHYGEIDVSVAWKGLKGVLAEGQLVWLRLRGAGIAWIHAYGGVHKLTVPPGKKLIVDNFHLVAMNASADWRIRKLGGLKTFILGGEGLVVEIHGPATVYIQTRTLPPLARLLYKFMPHRG